MTVVVSMPVSETFAIPRYADTIVAGGGTAGAVVAGLLAAGSVESILVLEAGPDYGPLTGNGWPAALKDASQLADSHDWAYDSGACYADRTVAFQRARVIGGCSAHNGCAAIWGSRLDYDAWAAAGNTGWATDDLLPLFQSANRRLRVRQPGPGEITPFQQACLNAAPAADIPIVADLNDLDEDIGMAPSPVNIHQGVRYNTAFGYLDPVRDRPNLTILGNMPVDRLLLDGDHVTGVVAVGPDGPVTIEAGRVVVAGGTYGSPAILLRSGIGDPEELRQAGVTPTHALPGVGRNLHDHPSIFLSFAGSPELQRQMRAFGARHWAPEEQTIGKARSSHCAEAFDLHLYPVNSPDLDNPGNRSWAIFAACMTPRARGTLRLAGADPATAPVIDHQYLCDVDGHDRRVLVDAIKLARAMAAAPSLANLIGAELAPGPEVRTDDAIADWIDRTVQHYFHPVGTCKMGPASDAEAVVDLTGRIHGLANAYVADCSIMPVVPRANTNIPAVVVGERIGRWLARSSHAFNVG
ncbi:MAG: GMC family oxidoreductase [Thermomicrobiales bacterium]